MRKRDLTADALRWEADAARDLIAELNSDDAALVHDMTEGETGLMEAIDAALDEIDGADVVIEGCKAKIAQLKERADAAERRQERVRTLLEQAMLVAGLDTVKRPCATLSVSRRAPKPIYTDESAIPTRFWKQPDPVLDRAAINAAVKDGEAVPGVSLSNGGTSLTIRRK